MIPLWQEQQQVGPQQQEVKVQLIDDNAGSLTKHKLKSRNEDVRLGMQRVRHLNQSNQQVCMLLMRGIELH